MSTALGRLLAGIYTMQQASMAEISEAVGMVPAKELSGVWNATQDVKYCIEMRWKNEGFETNAKVLQAAKK